MSFTYAVCPNCEKVNRVPLGAENARQPVCGNCGSPLPVGPDGVMEISGKHLEKLSSKSPLPVVTDFWAPWCGPCRAFAPVFKDAARQFAGRAVFAKVNTESDPVASDLFRIRSIPTLLLMRGGKEATRQSGAMPLPMLKEWIDSSI